MKAASADLDVWASLVVRLAMVVEAITFRRTRWRQRAGVERAGAEHGVRTRLVVRLPGVVQPQQSTAPDGVSAQACAEPTLMWRKGAGAAGRLRRGWLVSQQHEDRSVTHSNNRATRP